MREKELVLPQGCDTPEHFVKDVHQGETNLYTIKTEAWKNGSLPHLLQVGALLNHNGLERTGRWDKEPVQLCLPWVNFISRSAVLAVRMVSLHIAKQLSLKNYPCRNNALPITNLWFLFHVLKVGACQLRSCSPGINVYQRGFPVCCAAVSYTNSVSNGMCLSSSSKRDLKQEQQAATPKHWARQSKCRMGQPKHRGAESCEGLSCPSQGRIAQHPSEMHHTLREVWASATSLPGKLFQTAGHRNISWERTVISDFVITKWVIPTCLYDPMLLWPFSGKGFHSFSVPSLSLPQFIVWITFAPPSF